jgi:C4-dicarboxylate transporter DctM subunit
MAWALLIGTALLIALLECPLFTVFAGISAGCLLISDPSWQSLQMIPIEMNRLTGMPVLTALPLFTFAGCLLTASQSPRRVTRFLQAAFGWLPGGVGIAALGSCAFFTALTGASGITIVAVGGFLYPILRQEGYDEPFSTGLLTTAGSRGLLFPPSLPVILYGVVAQVDIAAIFKTALVPAVASILVVGLYTALRQRFGRSRAAVSTPRAGFSIGRLATATWGCIWEAPIIVIVIGGVFGGWVTVAEVSTLIVAYLLVVLCLIKREVHWRRQLPSIMVESVLLSGAVIIVLAMALGFTGYLVDQQIPQHLTRLINSLTDQRVVFLAALNLFLLAAGCLLDIFSAIVILVPLLIPLAETFQVDPLHLAVIFLLNLEIGYSTPPIGMNLFIAHLKFGQPLSKLYRATLPFLGLMLMVLILVTYAWR